MVCCASALFDQIEINNLGRGDLISRSVQSLQKLDCRGIKRCGKEGNPKISGMREQLRMPVQGYGPLRGCKADGLSKVRPSAGIPGRHDQW